MKKLFIALTLLTVSLTLFAQDIKSVGLTDNDVKNWAKNCVAIHKYLFEIGVNTNVLTTVKDKNDIEIILQKYGICAPNNIEKYAVILQCATILNAENKLDEQTKAIMELTKTDPFAEVKKNINSKDYSVVKANSKAVLNAITELEKL